jgi:iron complex outermembrane recepter protein
MFGLHSRAAARLSGLLGTASFISMAGALSAQAQMQAAVQEQVPEQVLITGSLIRGTVAVGAPVTSLGPQDFATTGSLQIDDVLATVPSINTTFTAGAANDTASSLTGGFSYAIGSINIHGLQGAGGFTRTLTMVDGMRMALMGTSSIQYDPSIIPGIALDRIDILANGASATYGSEAIAGVVNVILKRGFDGAILQSTVGDGTGGGFSFSTAGLLGRTWDGGDITLSAQYSQGQALKAKDRSYYTQNFTPWGLNNDTPVASSIIPIISQGKPNVLNGTGCTNCYSVPKGQDGVGLTWAQLQANAGTGNEVNPTTDEWITPDTQWTSTTGTFDQQIFPGVQFNAEGYYANRRTQLRMVDTTSTTFAIPTTNPYYPVGAPAGLVANLAWPEIPNEEHTAEISDRYTGGFTVDLPATWQAKLYGSTAQDITDRLYPVPQLAVVANNVNAALGNTIAATPASLGNPGLPSFTKPASVPYLNVFCDPTAFNCFDPATLNYINDRNTNDSVYTLHEVGLNFDGPVTDLPGGVLRAAVGGEYISENYFIDTITNPVTTQVPVSTTDSLGRSIWAAFGQLNIPILGNGFSLPFAERLEIQLSDRFDHYSDVGSTNNPKYSADLTVVDGLIIRGSYGTNFNAPGFKALSSVLGREIGSANGPTGSPSGGGATSLAACTIVGGTPVPGSVAAVLNPTCSAANQFPIGLEITGGVGGLAGITRPAGASLVPETAKDWAYGFEIAPTNGMLGFLTGLDVQATVYRVVINNTIIYVSDMVGNGLNDPNTAYAYLLKGDPRFATALAFLYANPLGAIQNIPMSSVQWINDGASRNVGNEDQEGIDFNASYDWQLADFGAWNTGITGNYQFHDRTATLNGESGIDIFDTAGLALRSRMRYRARLGWANDEGLSVTAFMNYQAHFFTTVPFPPTSYLATYPDYSNLVPSQYTFDVSVGYNTGDTPANDYLKRINITFAVNNILNRQPPFEYGGTGTQVAVNGLTIVGPLGRAWRLTLTKQF